MYKRQVIGRLSTFTSPLIIISKFYLVFIGFFGRILLIFFIFFSSGLVFSLFLLCLFSGNNSIVSSLFSISLLPSIFWLTLLSFCSLKTSILFSKCSLALFKVPSMHSIVSAVGCVTASLRWSLFWLSLSMCSIFSLRVSLNSLLEFSIFLLICLKSSLVPSLMPVSYTHLDVYKRQLLLTRTKNSYN